MGRQAQVRLVAAQRLMSHFGCWVWACGLCSDTLTKDDSTWLQGRERAGFTRIRQLGMCRELEDIVRCNKRKRPASSDEPVGSTMPFNSDAHPADDANSGDALCRALQSSTVHHADRLVRAGISQPALAAPCA